MAPVRRYLRITKYSVLECRIYLENPALVQSWLLNPREPMLARVIESVRPWVLPKLREERDRARKKSSNKKKGIKDTVVEGTFASFFIIVQCRCKHITNTFRRLRSIHLPDRNKHPALHPHEAQALA